MPERLFLEGDPHQSISAIQQLFSAGVDRPTRISRIDTWKQDLSGLPSELQIDPARRLLRLLHTQDTVHGAQDIRDVALELLAGVNLSVITGQLIPTYVDILSQPENRETSDIYGGLSALLEAGKLMAPYVTLLDDQWSITREWGSISLSYRSDDERRYVDQEVEALKGRFPEQQTAVEVRRAQRDREQPNLTAGQQRMLDFYRESVGANGSFKLTLWERSQQFKQLCASYGIELEHYWNLRDPDKLLEKFTRLQQLAAEGISIPPLVNSLFKSRLGVSITDITPEQVRVAADEVTAILFEVKSGLSSSRAASVHETLQRLHALVKDAKGLSQKTQNYTVKSIESLLVKAGIKRDINTTQEAEAVLSDQDIIRSLELLYQQKTLSVDQFAQFLELEFARDEPDPRFRLISRTRNDLYLGDRSADCTAFYLNAGFNAWTIPAWLGHPGFNTLVSRVAKTSFFLSVADGQPVLVVDSFETFTGIEDEEQAKQEIRASFELLGEWARRIGLREVYLNTIVNSSGAVALLKELSFGQQTAVGKITLLGGLSALKPVYPDGDFSMYVQSSAGSEDGEEQELTAEHLRWRNELVGSVESWCKDALEESSKSNERHLVEAAIKNADWPVIFKYFVRGIYPEVATRLGIDWKTYEPLFKTTRIVDRRTMDYPESENMRVACKLYSSTPGWSLPGHIERLELYDAAGDAKYGSFYPDYAGSDDEDLVEAVIADERLERGLAELPDETEIDSDVTDLDLQARHLDDDLAHLKGLEMLGFTIEDALRQIGGTVIGSEEEIILNPRLSRLRFP